MSQPTDQELLQEQKDLVEKFNKGQVEQDKLRQRYEIVTALINDRAARTVQQAPVACETPVTPTETTPGADAVTVERGS